MTGLPIFLKNETQHVLLIGINDAAMAKLALILPYGLRITVIGNGIEEAVKRAGLHLSIDPSRVQLHDRDHTEADLIGATLIYASLDDFAAEKTLSEAARARAIPVNIVDQPSISTFITPAQFNRGPLQVAFSSGGVAPVFVRRLRALLERAVPPSLGVLADAAGKAKDAVKRALPGGTQRRQFWDRLFDDADSLSGLTVEDATTAIANRAQAHTEDQYGLVQLVGSGPGDADLLTLRAHRALQQADVVLYDRLVSQDVLALARRDAKLLYVGKKEGEHGIGQTRIQALMIEHAEKGERVVRLKSGDPLMFARAGEELAALREAGIACEVVPGITALTGIAAATQIPLTDRAWSSSVTLVTGHCQDGQFKDWARLAGKGQTLAIYMGIKSAPGITEGLTREGVSPLTPVAVIENGTRPEERRFYGTLSSLSQLITLNQVQSPALLIIGDVVRTAVDWNGDQHLETLTA